MAEIYDNADGRLRARRGNPVIPVLIALAIAATIYFLVAWAVRPGMTRTAGSNAQPGMSEITPAPFSSPNTYNGAHSSAPSLGGPSYGSSSDSGTSSGTQGTNMVAPPGPAAGRTGATTR